MYPGAVSDHAKAKPFHVVQFPRILYSLAFRFLFSGVFMMSRGMPKVLAFTLSLFFYTFSIFLSLFSAPIEANWRRNPY
jgi:hypothetical protein